MCTRQSCPLVLFILALFCVSILLPAAANGQDKPNPILEQVQSKVKHANQPFTMLVHLQAKEGAGRKLEAAFAPAIKATRKEKGCLAYDLNRDLDHPNVYLLYERWKTLADLEAHLKAEHISSLVPKLSDLMTGPLELKVLLPAAE